MNFKKWIALLLALAMAAGVLAGCGGNKEPVDEAPVDGASVDGAVSGDADGDGIPDQYANLAYFDTEHPERYGGKLTQAIGTADAHLDINAAGATSGTSYWARYVYESALATGIDGKLYPLVCEYTYDEENHSWLELTVREGVTFHDGSLVEIEDVWASYNRNPKYQHILDGITNVEIADGVLHIDYDPAVGCIKALYWFGYHDASFGIMPKEICEQWSGFETGVITAPQYVIGTGAYKLIAEEYVPMELYPLARHEGYLPSLEGGAPDYPNGSAEPRIAYLDRIDLVVNTDSNTSMMQLMQGNYDVIFANIDTFARLEPMGYQMYVDPTGKPISDTPAMFFNLHTAESAVGDGKASTSILADDPNLRKAICAAINIDEAMYAYYSDWWIECASPVLIDGYSTDAFDNAEYRNKEGDIEEAKEYLAQSNYNGETLVIRYPSGSGSSLCNVIKKNCEAVGIKIDVELMDISAYQQDFRMGASGWDMYITFGANTFAWAGFMPVNSYITWGNTEGAALRAELFSEMNGTAESIAAWEALSQLMADECSYFVLGKSKGDRFVTVPGLNVNCSGYTRYCSAYWDNPSEHMD